MPSIQFSDNADKTLRVKSASAERVQTKSNTLAETRIDNGYQARIASSGSACQAKLAFSRRQP
jgi:hypothetical protein